MSEARVDVEQIKEEWLVGNAVVAFVGALLMAQTWEPSEVRNEIPLLGVTVPVTPQMVVLGIVAFLAILSFALAVASAVPPLRTWAIKHRLPGVGWRWSCWQQRRLGSCAYAAYWSDLPCRSTGRRT